MLWERLETLGGNSRWVPDTKKFDFSMSKSFPIGRLEPSHLDFRADFFNGFNLANFGNPQANITSPSFGSVATALNPRVIQLALKYNF